MDAFHYDISNQKQPAASGVYNQPVVTPKIGMAWTPVERLSAFFNMGQGFRSLDQSEISPSGSTGPLGAAGGNAVLTNTPPKVTSYDYSFKTRVGLRWTAAAAGFYTLNQTEIVSTGPYTYVPSGNSTCLYSTAAACFWIHQRSGTAASLADTGFREDRMTSVSSAQIPLEPL